ncbi:MAG: isopeptide-forming domain-containing fimbrial protein [Oscillospiraceae bacterium]|nr:isopeptide-forming domain-containing fimbrial protein [Oscillospiraceae bacterium]
MKKTRRFAAMVAALTLATCSIAPAMMMNANAAGVYVDTTNGDTENGYMADTENHTYTAYPIFTGTYGTDGLTVTDWADGYNFDGLIADTDFKAMKTGTDTDATVAKDMNDITTNKGTVGATEVSKMLEDIKTYDSDKLDELAKILYKYKGTAQGKELGKTADNATPLAVGYYVVNDSYTGTDGKNDALSRYILQVSANDETIKLVPKKSYPTVEKKVKEDDKTVTGKPKNDATTTEKWNDVADYDIGEAVPFKLYGTMPATLADYSAYYYKFTDTLGLQFDQPTSLTITVGSATLTATWDATNSKYNVIGDTGTNCRVTWDNGTLTISFENIKAYTGVTASTVVTVEYTAVLNDTANIGLPGQTNAVNLTYSNNPNFEYTPNTDDENEDTPTDDNDTPDDKTDDKEQTDKTPDDKVIVFTYELDVNKIDGTKKTALQGAEFTLQNSDSQYAKVDSNGKFLGWVATTGTDTAGTTTLTSGADGIFKVIGIDDGTYTLTETKAPEGYTEMASPVTLVISAQTVNNQVWDDFVATSALTSIKLGDVTQDDGTENGKRGHVSTTVENNKGASLPSTGGIGTTLFYLAGGVMVVGAGIVLVTKKRTGKED